MIIDGKAIAEEIYTELKTRRSKIERPVRLGIIVAGDDPVIESFIKIKSRVAETLDITIDRVDLGADASTGDVFNAIHELVTYVDGLIVQLPLPDAVDINAVMSELPVPKDVDAMSTLTNDEHRPVFAPVALAVVEILRRGGMDPMGKRAVVVGAGRLVGAPTAGLLKRLGAEVNTVTLESGSLLDLKGADIVVLGAGQPGSVLPEHLSDGVALIDAGTSEDGGVIKGDADPACADKASIFTPVPGGVGPIAVAMIFKNLLDLIEKGMAPSEVTGGHG